MNRGRLTDVEDVAVGHWTDPIARTGCTVVLLPEGTVASGEVRGGAPASREFALLDPGCTVAEVDAVVLTGGSAFGLAAADGVMEFLESRGRGAFTPAGRVPIVPTLGLFDLGVGDASVRPGRDAGLVAAKTATTDGHNIGAVGAGTGCTTGNWLGSDQVRPSGLVAASIRVADSVVAALVAVNAFGSIGAQAHVPVSFGAEHGLGLNTTVGIVVTSASLNKTDCHLLAQSAHDGLARAVFPTHTRFDGDAFIAAATGTDTQTEVSIDLLRMAACTVVEQAIATLI